MGIGDGLIAAFLPYPQETPAAQVEVVPSSPSVATSVPPAANLNH
jgi:hypothetical protein